MTTSAPGPDIYAFWAQCRRDEPVRSVGGPDSNMWFVTRRDDVEQVLRDAEHYSSSVNALTMGPVMGTVILAMDGAEHRRYRNLVAHAFRPSALARWEADLIAPTVHGLIDAFADAGHAELVAQLTSRFPVQVIAGVMGVPVDDFELFQSWSEDINLGPENYPVSIAASEAMRAYLTPIVEERKAHPRDDLVSDIVTAEIDGERLGDEHIYGFLRLLLPAGAETTYRAMGSCLWALLSHPDVLDRVRADHSMIPGVIEETLRWETSVTMVNRENVVPIDLAGVELPRGASVVCALGSADRDERHYAHGEDWDMGRSESGHLAFGTGRHQCLGMHLARLELRVGLAAVLDRLPGLRWDDRGEPAKIEGLAFRGPDRLPVRFDVADSA
jgi:cytochrome P450